MQFSMERVINMKITKSMGMLLLSIWLIMAGLMQLISIPIPGIIMSLLVIVAGVLILIVNYVSGLFSGALR